MKVNTNSKESSLWNEAATLVFNFTPIWIIAKFLTMK